MSPPRDSGALRRAVELAVAALPGRARELPGFGDAPLEPSMGHLASRLSRATGATARERVLPVREILEAVRGGVVAVGPTNAGWWVADSRRFVHVTAHGEHRRALGRRAVERLLGRGPGRVILLEPSLGLGPLEATSAGGSSPWGRLRALLSMEARELWALVVYAVVLGALSLAVPVAVQVLVNTIAFGSLLQPLVVLAILLFAVLSFSGALQIVEWHAVEILQRRLFVRIAEDFARRLPRMRFDVHDRLDARELTNHFLEVATLQKTIGRLVLEGLGLALQTLVGLILLAFYHPFLLAFDVGLVLCLGGVVILGAGAVSTALDESAAKYRLAGWLETVAGAPEVFKRPGGALMAATRADALTREYLGARKMHYRRLLRQLVGGVGVQIIAMVVLLGLGGWLVMQGELTLGQLVAAELVVGLVAAGFSKMGKQLEAVYDLLAGLGKVGKVVDQPCEQVALREVRDGGLGLYLDAMVPTDDAAPITDVLVAGSKRWLPRDGTGRARRVLEILAGFRAPAGGALLGDGDPDRELDRTELRARAMLVRGDDIIAGSVLDNLRLGDPDLDEERARDVLGRVRLSETIARLPQGLGTQLLPRGGPLTPGERRRLVLARAMVASPDLLLVDGCLDQLGLDEPERCAVLDTVLGPNAGAAWTVVASSNEAEVRRRCSARLGEGRTS